ncbi:LytR/AlgR family response regulator transcription factor [Maribacter sp. 2307ULW6-5]|uniref:LytR/AlgR family response regulator transcription factor n=1 Tax=Maribacter sp. 2307ULW6-5 TaxID=3386275 RepID=UPI0039BCAE03
MSSMKFSMNRVPSRRFWLKCLAWSLFWFLPFFFWYRQFFAMDVSIVLAITLTIFIGGMLFTGYFLIGKRKKFPRLFFWGSVVVFSTFRFCLVYFVLQHKVGIDSVFHYPERAIYFIVMSSAAFVFWGYSYTIYEWGLAAKEKYLRENKNLASKIITQPIVIRSGGKNVHLLPSDILYLEASGEYVNYITENGNFLCFQRMKKAETDMMGYGFLRIHRSTIINKKHLKSFSTTELELKNGKKFSISAKFKDQFLNKI